MCPSKLLLFPNPHFPQGHITTGLERWQYVFLIFGAISIAWAILFLIFMPDLPSTARFLTEDEKVVAVERVAINRQGVKNKSFKKYQLWQFLKDPKTWILFTMSVCLSKSTEQVNVVQANTELDSCTDP